MNSYSAISLLIVDDEAEIRSGLRTIIPWEEYSVSVTGTAPNGAEALNMIRYYEPDIVITDIQMPGMNGLELVRRAKEEQFECAFVILSGYDDFHYAKTAIKYGVTEYLLKPISIQELTELVIKLRSDIIHKREYRTDQLSTLKDLRTAQILLRKHNLIPQLLRGELGEEELLDVIREYCLPVKNICSRAVLIQAFASGSEAREDGELNQYLIPLKEALEQELPGQPVLISEQPPAGLLVIFNLPLPNGQSGDMRELLQNLASRFETDCTVRIVSAAGREVPSLLEISSSWQDARLALSWHIYPEIGSVIDFSVTEIKEPPVLMPGNAIFDCILKEDEEGIKNSLYAYMEQLLYIPTPPPSFLYGMCNYLIINTSSRLSQYLGTSPRSFSGNSYVTLLNLPSLNEIKNWMCDTLCGFSRELSVSRATKNDPLIEKAMAFINRNLLKNLHTEDVCNYLGLSKSYFSTYFKNKTQLNFRDYTLDLKISYAQEQLKLPEHTPGEVSILLGYEDYRSFSRAFKARTGFTPSDYQKQYTGEERSTS